MTSFQIRNNDLYWSIYWYYVKEKSNKKLFTLLDYT